MAYLGEGPIPINRGLTRKDSFTGDGSTTTFDLTVPIPNVTENDIEVFVDNVRQEPGSGKAYTLGLDGSNNFNRVTFTVAPTSSSVIYVLSGSGRTTLLTVPDGSVTSAKIATGAVTSVKLSDSIVTTAKLVDSAVTSAKIADGTIVTDDIANSAITGDKVNSTFDISTKTVTLPSTFTTNSGSQTLTNKIIDGSFNTISNLDNSTLTNSTITINGTPVSLGGSVTAGTDWQTVVVADGSTTTTGAAGKGYFIDTTSAVHTINLPGSATLGDEISIIDYSGTADTNNITVGRNGHNIQGDSADLTISTERAALTLVYSGATQGWLLKDK